MYRFYSSRTNKITHKAVYEPHVNIQTTFFGFQAANLQIRKFFVQVKFQPEVYFQISNNIAQLSKVLEILILLFI